MVSFEQVQERASILSIFLTVYLAAVGLAILLTPQHPVNWMNKWILWPGIALAVSLWRDLSK